jgi:hypothetical protein
VARDGRTGVVVAGGRQCSTGGWLSVGWREGGDGGRRERWKAFGGQKCFGRNLNEGGSLVPIKRSLQVFSIFFFF